MAEPLNQHARQDLGTLFDSAFAAQKQGDLLTAEQGYRQILAANSGHFNAQHMLGVIQLIWKQYQEAEQSLLKATSIKPDNAQAFYNLGLCQDNLGKKTAAVESYSKAVALNPKDEKPYNNRGKTLRELGFARQSLLDCDQAIKLKPDYAAAYNNRGIALRDLKQYNEAIASYVKALTLEPNLADALYNLSNLLQEQKRYDEALAPLGKLLSIAPYYPFGLGAFLNSKLHGCDWNDYEAITSAVIRGIQARQVMEVPFSFLAYSHSASDQLCCSQIYSQNKYPPAPKTLWKDEIYQHDKIRVAYLSADFHNHATSYLMAGLFEAQDKQRFDYYAISFGPAANDEMRQRIEPCFKQFIDARELHDEAVANMLREMEIDIAIDLKGYTGDSRTHIFAHRPAPIQVNYLGYPGTMGCSYFDYIIADPHVIPADQQQYYSEKIAYLPDTYQANDNKRPIAAKTISRQQAGLPESGFVFCCFNNNYKINPQIFDIWMRLLHQIEGSVLWLLEDNPTAMRNLQKEAEKRGINTSRLVFAGRVKVDEHLGRQQLADLFLDTLPYNAHTTASDALWAGLPLITCQGSSFAGRVASSLLTALNMQELITNNLQEYEALALELATNKHKLNAIRNKLRQHIKSEALFDTGRFSRNLEAAYLQMHARYQSGLRPDHIHIQPS